MKQPRAYTTYAEMAKANKTLMNKEIPQVLAGGLKEGFSRISDFGPAVPAEVKAVVDTAKSDLSADKRVIFSGGLKDNKGNIVVPEGDAFKSGDPRLNTINWLVEGITADT